MGSMKEEAGSRYRHTQQVIPAKAGIQTSVIPAKAGIQTSVIPAQAGIQVLSG